MALCTHTTGRIQLCIKFILFISTVSVIISVLVIIPQYSIPPTWTLLNNTYIIQQVHADRLIQDRTRFLNNINNTYDENLPSVDSSLALQPTNETILLSKNIEEVMKTRRKRVQEVCKKPEIASPEKVNQMKLTKTMDRVVFNRKYKLAWCPIYKSGSSSWMEMFADMAGALTPAVRRDVKKGKTQINNVVKAAYARRNRKADMKDVFTVTRSIIVRHPFERILSAYRDKLEHIKNRKYYYDKYGRQIVSIYKKNRDPDSPYFNKTEPTFVEFLRFIEEKHKYDEHWRPYTLECSPCVMDYQAILKMENFIPEEKYVIDKLGLQEFVIAQNQTDKRNYNQNPRGRTDLSESMKYYSEVPCNILKKVYEVYEEDFLMFDYSPEQYYEICKK